MKLAILSAILLALPFANGNLWIFAWFGFVPLFFALNNKSLKEAFFLFFIAGVIFWSATVYWLVHVTLAGTAVLVIYLALYFAIFGLIIRPHTRHSSPYVLLFIPSVWVLLEYARGHLLTGFPWALLGYSQYLNLPAIQIADITGAWGVSFLVMLVNAGIVEMVWSGRNRMWPRLRRVAIILVFILSMSLYYGYSRLRQEALTGKERRIKISVIQPNISQELKWDPDARPYIQERYSALTAAAAAQGSRLIIWPEAAIPGILGEDDTVFRQVFSLARDTGIPLLSGAVVREGENFFNSALLIDASGRFIYRYDKLHLVPFGEYIPLKKILPFLETVVPIGDITPGKEYILFGVRSSGSGVRNKFGVLICFEDLFPELSREFVKRGADFLVNMTNDAWYKETSAPYQHLQASVFRAVENRIYLARSANTGVSGFISPQGRIYPVGGSGGKNIFVQGLDSREIPVRQGPLSLYSRFADAFIFLLCIFVIYSIFRFILAHAGKRI